MSCHNESHDLPVNFSNNSFLLPFITSGLVFQVAFGSEIYSAKLRIPSQWTRTGLEYPRFAPRCSASLHLFCVPLLELFWSSADVALAVACCTFRWQLIRALQPCSFKQVKFSWMPSSTSSSKSLNRGHPSLHLNGSLDRWIEGHEFLGYSHPKDCISIPEHEVSLLEAWRPPWRAHDGACTDPPQYLFAR